jgi:peptidoglycan-N-acetylglucosamine deacetylase
MIANLSLDLDNKWSYLQSAGKPSWPEFPSYLDRAVPRIIKKLDEHALKITMFVVGRDVERPTDRPMMQKLVEAGHELSNHSYSHQPWLHLMDRAEIEHEIGYTDQLIREVQGTSALGFRGPGYSDSPVVRQVLTQLNYRYCASPFPSIIGPAARLYYFAKTGLRKPEDKQQRERLFGRLRDCLAYNVPKLERVDEKSLWVMPVTVMPAVRIPIHFSYLLFIAERSMLMAQTYFRFGLTLCRMFGVMPSLLLHPLDFLGNDDEPELGFFPGMKQSASQKLARLSRLLKDYQNRFEVLSMSQHVARLDPQ